MTEEVTALPTHPLRNNRVANNIIPVVVDRDTNEGCCCPPLLLVALPPVGVVVGASQFVCRVAIGSTMAFK